MDDFFTVIPNQKLLCRSCTRDGFVEGPINGAECDVQSRTLNMNCIEYENMPLSLSLIHHVFSAVSRSRVRLDWCTHVPCSV